MAYTQYRIMRSSVSPDGAPVPVLNGARITDLRHAQDLIATAKSYWSQETPLEKIPTFWVESRVISEWHKTPMDRKD